MDDAFYKALGVPASLMVQPLGLSSNGPSEIEAWHATVNAQHRLMKKRIARTLVGPRADKRTRRKRLRKKLAKRGNMRRTRGLVQTYHAVWPWLTRP